MTESEQTTHPAGDIAFLEPKELIDKFISDVLLPVTTGESVPSRDTYRWFEQYCQHLELVPGTISLFSRHMKTRFQHRRVNGTLEFFCILKPELRATK